MTQEDVSPNVATMVEKSVTFTAFKPQLIVEAQKVGDAVEFYKAVFGAEETGHSLYPKRKADQELLTSFLPSSRLLAPPSLFLTSPASKETMTGILETDDLEAAVSKALAAGAIEVEEEVEGGGVKGKVTDPFGFTWIFVSPVK
ncbi:hypothetical protein Bca4012_059644 [Brassica carinata]|uniref:Glyoxalase-like domain-containing protein n=1 Tax=Brassica carinata TaxID=52824 RepID=A0A8X7S5G4_BRACI|nr:hypothetical protein Bca52824_030024 [Brassica carinata]